MQSLLASDRAAVVGVINPDLNAAGTVTTAWIEAGLFNSFLAVVMAGTLGASATLDAKIEQATDAAGTDAKDVEDKAITQLTKAGGDDDAQAIINIAPDDLDLINNFGFFRVSMTVATASSDSAVTVLGLEPRYGPASANDLATVAEIV
ncbi:MAG: hypothetical protein AAF183_12985 [Pseudomonadota bacterium]